MAKPNTYLLLKKAEQEIRMLQENIYLSKGMTIQQCIDMAKIALNQEFNFGPVYNQRFERRFREVFVEFAELCVEDGAADEEIVYTKEVLDRWLRAAQGDDILPFDERYATERMYFRDRRDEWKDGR